MARKKTPLVAVCGKFQPFHNEHLQYVLRAFEEGYSVVIGITNSDPQIMTRHEEADPARGSQEANPYTYHERSRMIKNCLADEGIDLSLFDIVPFPINIPDVWHYYVPETAVFLITLYDDDPWLKVRQKRLEDKFVVQVLWVKESKGIEGCKVRSLISQNLPWEHLVPSGTAKVIKEALARSEH